MNLKLSFAACLGIFCLSGRALAAGSTDASREKIDGAWILLQRENPTASGEFHKPEPYQHFDCWMGFRYDDRREPSGALDSRLIDRTLRDMSQDSNSCQRLAAAYIAAEDVRIVFTLLGGRDQKGAEIETVDPRTGAKTRKIAVNSELAWLGNEDNLKLVLTHEAFHGAQSDLQLGLYHGFPAHAYDDRPKIVSSLQKRFSDIPATCELPYVPPQFRKICPDFAQEAASESYVRGL